MQIERKISVGNMLQIGFLIVALSGGHFLLKYEVADAGERAERAEKLSAINTTQISNLKEIVNELTTAIKVQNETVRWQYQLQSNEIRHLKDRLGDFERRLYSGAD